MRMHAHQYRFDGVLNITAHQSDVRFPIELASICPHREVAKPGGHQRRAFAMHIALVSHTVADQLCHRDHL